MILNCVLGLTGGVYFVSVGLKQLELRVKLQPGMATMSLWSECISDLCSISQCQATNGGAP